MRLESLGTAAAVFLVALGVYVASAPIVPESHDTTSNAYVPVSLLTHGDVVFRGSEAPLMFLWVEERAEGTFPVTVQSWQHPGSVATFADEYRDGRLKFVGPRYYLVPTIRQDPETKEPLFASAFGPGAGLTALPAAATAVLLGARLTDAYVMFRAASWTAALLVAGSVTMVYVSALAFLLPMRALGLAALYAFGTCIWTISSRGLWQQTAELFFVSVGIACMVRLDRAWLRGAGAGLAFSIAVACRPTAALLALVAVACLCSDRRALLGYVVAALPVGLAVLAYNLYYFGSPFDFGQLVAGASIAQEKTGSTDVWQTPLWLGAAGLLISPSRGLLVYSPFLAAGLAGGLIALKDERYTRLRFAAVALPLLWLPAFVWFDWWGGWAYGYRPIVDTAPLLAALCAPAIERMRRPAVKTAFAVAAGWSVFVQLLGVGAYTPGAWNGQRADGTLANVDLPEHRGRLWSFRDWQIGYLAARAFRSRER